MDRPGYIARVRAALRSFPVVALLGPRQCGKTTVARVYAARWPRRSVIRFDLEDPGDLARLADPKLALQDLAAWSWSMRCSGPPRSLKCCACWWTGPATRPAS